MGWGLGLSVLAPFWNKPHWPVRLHSFVNLGKVVGYDKSELFYISVGLDLTD
jgi:outer membrane protein insertion porin family